MKPGKNNKTVLVAVKSKASPPAKKALKQPAKPVTVAKKPPAKPVVKKTVVQSSAKSTAKSSAKPSARPTVKTAVAKKPVAVKKPVPVKKAAAKPVAKAPLKLAPVRAVAKKPVPAKVAKSVVKTSIKAPVKVGAKAPAKAPVKAVIKAPAKAVVKPAAKPAVKTAAKAPVSPPAKAAEPVAKKTSTKVITKMPEGKTGRKRPSSKPVAPSMTEAEMTPSHDPSAVKATFISDQKPTMSIPAYVPIKRDPKRANNWKTLALDQLTDADMLAMAESEYMNKVQMAYFRSKLATLKQDILTSASETTEHLREDTVVVPDPTDRATIEEEHALELRTRDRERKLLKKIEQSIMRIDADDYGFCDETGEAIGVGRLLARPTANLSLEAQQRRELKQKMFGD